MSSIIEVIIGLTTLAGIIVGVLAVLFGFGFLGDALGKIMPELEGIGTPFYAAGWIFVAAIFIILVILGIKAFTEH